MVDDIEIKIPPSGDPLLHRMGHAVGATRVPAIANAKDMGLIVRSYRKAAGMSQQELADYAGVGRRFISDLENGKSTVAFGLVVNVAAALGIELVIRTRR
jgi:y4mF family transcriptional regulator